MIRVGAVGLGLAVSMLAARALAAGADESGEPIFRTNGALERPSGYREWVFVTSGLGMTYGPAGSNSGPPMFDNVFVNRRAYAAFSVAGKWPDGTMFVLEVRRGEENVSINHGGRTQGEIVALEVSVKDSARFPDGGWGFYDFGVGESALDSAKPLRRSASCYECHAKNAALDNTFVQFYPTLQEIARRHGTIKPSAEPGSKP
jgi:hypothetical protein